ncbi:MAG: monomethylamine:corrinoid methyltransferase [Acetobacteraceae bacterium]|nr:monomethylamine:corrinoid methyltransferase [Acetobacteraceae bacterium]
MAPMWDVVERAFTGPFCEEQDYLSRRLIPALQAAVKRHRIKYDPATPVPWDDALADAVWQAAVELFLEAGVYHQDTHRIILFSEEEVREALYAAPESYTVGSGRDARTFGRREVEDARPPFCILSPDITYDEPLFLPVCLAYLREPLLDGFCAPVLESFLGEKIKAYTPLELGGSLEHAMSLREAARLIGRPGVFLVAVGTAESDSAQISVSQEGWGVRPTDSRLVGSITEFMTNNQLLNKAVHYRQYGCFSGSLTGAIYGGYAGGAEGTAVLETAYHLKGLLVHFCSYQQNFPFHLKYGSNTTRELLWVTSVYSQAIARNTRLVQTSNGFANAGPGTDMLLYEAAAHALASTVCGANLWEIATARNKCHNRATPLEARLAAEVGHAAARMRLTRRQANEIVLKLLQRYEAGIPDAPPGREFAECYDVAKARPRPEYLDQYRRVKRELGEMGIRFCY